MGVLINDCDCVIVINFFGDAAEKCKTLKKKAACELPTHGIEAVQLNVLMLLMCDLQYPPTPT